MAAPACPVCSMEDVLVHAARLECSTCGHEWPRTDAEAEPAEVARVVAVLAQAGLPTHSPDLGVDAWLGHMGHDKKVENGQLRFVLLEALGKAAVKSAVPVAVLQQVLQGTYIQQAKSPC